MTDPNAEAEVEDARIDGISRGSRFGGFVKGVLLGTLGSAVALVGLTLTQPLPSHLPGVGRVEVVASDDNVEASQEVEPEAEGDAGQDVATQLVAAGDNPLTEEDNTPAITTGGAGTADVGDSATGTAEVETDAVMAEPPDKLAVEERDLAAEQTQAEVTDGEEQAKQDTAVALAPVEIGQDAEQPAADAPAAEQANPELPDVREPEVEQPVAETEDAARTDTDSTAVPDADGAKAEVSDIEEPVETAALGPVPQISLSGPAVEVNSRPFDAPANAPLLAVVLEDPGKTGIAPGAMALLTMPLTFAVRPDRDGAQELADAARLAGHEVLAQLPLLAPDGNVETPTAFSRATSPDGLANATRRVMASLDVAIGATVPADAVIVNDRRAMEAILSPLGENGFAFLDLKSGIGSTAQRISKSGGFAYAESNRYAQESAAENDIYQMLDGAAFQARRQGTAIVTVGATADALKAIVRWGLERGGQEVWFAPLSAVIARRKAG